MAGGSQIIISADGITIKTAKQFKVFAGKTQHSLNKTVSELKLYLKTHYFLQKPSKIIR